MNFLVRAAVSAGQQQVASISRPRFFSSGYACSRFLLAANSRHQPTSYFTRTATFSSSATDESSGSHPDFAPQTKVKLESQSEIFSFIDKAVKDHPVLLFMKGSPGAPRCGFSAQVVRALQAQGVDFSSADVLQNDDLREGVKAYSEWPTIPQLYIKGEFVGGCDVVLEMEKSGDLAEALEGISNDDKGSQS